MAMRAVLTFKPPLEDPVEYFEVEPILVIEAENFEPGLSLETVDVDLSDDSWDGAIAVIRLGDRMCRLQPEQVKTMIKALTGTGRHFDETVAWWRESVSEADMMRLASG